MYLKDKKVRVTVRLNPEQMDYVLGLADVMNKSPSDVIRMLIDTARYKK